MPDSPLRLVRRAYDHPDAQLLVAEVQDEYVRRYGGPDETPVEIGEFSAPVGLFVVAYHDGEPVGTGAWRRLADEDDTIRWASPGAEIKRMFVRESYRRRGLAKVILNHLEQTARESGVCWLLLETGTLQPEAIALYRSTGYHPVLPFGHYADEELSVHLGKRLVG